jgi:hypothetical protein
MISRYNGKQFTFDIYSHKVDSVVPKFNLLTEDINGSYTFTNGYTAYYETTEEKNGTEIVLDIKRHHRQLYIDAVKSQLLYFNEVDFIIKSEYGERNIDFKANILYEDDYIVLSDNDQFSKPHLVVGKENSKVCYGYIDFLELELENKVGNIGIKVESEEIAINPSRESVIWNDLTRTTVINRFNTVVELATKLVTEELKEEDFLLWYNKCVSLTSYSSYSQNIVLNRLSRIIDKNLLKPTYPKDSTIKFNGSLMFDELNLSIRCVTKSYDYKKQVEVINRTPIKDNSLHNLPIYITRKFANNKKDKYLLTVGSKSFNLIVVPEIEEDLSKINPLTKKEDSNELLKDYLIRKQKFINYLLESKEYIDYDALEVPDTFEATDDEAYEAEVVLTNAERRALEQKIPVNKLNNYSFDYGYMSQKFNWNRSEVKIADCLALEGDNLFYGFSDDTELLNLCAGTLCDYGSSLYLNGNYVIKISKDNSKKLTNFKHVSQYFATIIDNKLTMANALIKWHTAQLISESLDKLTYLFNFELFNADYVTLHKELRKYVNDHYRHPNISTSNLIEHFNKVLNAQLYVREHVDDTQAISDKMKELFGESMKGLDGAIGVDIDIYDKLQELLIYTERIGPIFQNMSILTMSGSKISSELERDIKLLLELKLNQ